MNQQIATFEPPQENRQQPANLLDSISDSEVQIWIGSDNLSSRDKRVYAGFEITNSIDGNMLFGRDVSLVRLNHHDIYPQHVHKHSETGIIVTAGSGLFLSGKTKRPVQPGDRIPIPKGMPHGFELAAGEFLEFISVQSPPIRNRTTGAEDVELTDATDLV